MHALDEAALRSSFVNVSLRERRSIPIPDLGSLPVEDLGHLGWRDTRVPALGYVVVEVDDRLVGVLLRQTEARTRTRPQCSWCEDVELPNDVVFFGARRAGAAGRRGDSIGTLVCAGFECSANVRRRPSVTRAGFDADAERERRIAVLHAHVTGFVRRVLEDG
jgi:hypothetical protein